MDNLITLKLFIKNSIKTKNKFNKDLFNFLNNNYKEIIDSGFYIRIILIDESNIKKFLSLGIKTTPVLINENESENIISGVENIIKYIVVMCENKNSYDNDNDDENSNEDENISNNLYNEQNNNQKNDNNDLRSYLMSEVMSKDDGPEEALDLNKVKSYEDSYNKNRERLQSRNVNTNKNIINNASNNYSSNVKVDNNSEEAQYINSKNELTKTRKISDYIDNDNESKQFWENLEETVI